MMATVLPSRSKVSQFLKSLIKHCDPRQAAFNSRSLVDNSRSSCVQKAWGLSYRYAAAYSDKEKSESILSENSVNFEDLCAQEIFRNQHCKSEFKSDNFIFLSYSLSINSRVKYFSRSNLFLCTWLYFSAGQHDTKYPINFAKSRIL